MGIGPWVTKDLRSVNPATLVTRYPTLGDILISTETLDYNHRGKLLPDATAHLETTCRIERLPCL